MSEQSTADQRSIDDLLDTASLVFSGTVAEVAASTVDLVPVRATFAIVRVDRGLYVAPELGELRGRLVTVDADAAGTLRRGDAAIFFTRSRVHGRGILTREVARLGIEREADVAARVAGILERRLGARLRQATLVVLGEVIAIHPLPFQARAGGAAQWAAASLRVERTLKGDLPDGLTVLFPIRARPTPADLPRLSVKERGVFLLHSEPAPDLPAPALPPNTVLLAALHAADFQPEWLVWRIERLLAAPPKVLVVNCVPQERSDESNNDVEPSLAVNPANPDQIIITAATPPDHGKGDGPIYYSSDGGNTWRLVFEVPGGGGDDGSLALTASQRLYLAILKSGTNYLSVLRDDAPPSGSTLPTFDLRKGMDQPWAEAATTGSEDYLYIGYGDNAYKPQSASVDICFNARASQPTFQQLRLDPRQANPRDGDEIRPVVNPKGTVYVSYKRWRSNINDVDIRGDIVVARDDSWGRHGFGDLKDASDRQAGQLVATNVHFSDSYSTTAGRVLSDLAIAVHPAQRNVVYLAWGDVDAGHYMLRVRRSGNGGQTWSGDLVTALNATLACLAINAKGMVGFMYQSLVGDRWETHFLRSPDGTRWVDDLVLARTASGRFVGDYARVVAVGNDFYGVFPAMNCPDPQNFPCGVNFGRNVDPSTWQLLSYDQQDAIAPSVDPFFFKVLADG
jgi:hypothetical protein